MKTKLIITVFLLISHLSLLTSQVPQGFNYQAIARGSDGKEIANTTLEVKLSVLSDTNGFYAGGSGTYIWEEQQTVKTNGLGLFTLTLGNTSATKVQGSAATFSAINWNQQPLFIGTKINYSGWKNMGTSRLWSVPYAMNASNAVNATNASSATVASNLAGPVEKLEISGGTSVMDESLFEVRNKTGQIVFAVYNEGVRVYVDDGLAKGQGKGGFAIGSFGTAKAPSQEFFVVSPDSIRAYIGDQNAKPLKGGFAIGGFSKAKAPVEEYLRVTRDSTRVYTNPAAKGTKGGFAIGSFSPAKGLADNYLNVTKENYLIGLGAGKSTTTGTFNSFMGYQNGYSNTTGSQNVFIGNQTGYSNTSGSANIFVGNQSGLKITTGLANIFMGTGAGMNSLTGSHNIILGSASGVSNAANYNVFLGNFSGYKNTSGFSNFFAGYFAGFGNRKGSSNIYIGTQAGYTDSIGNSNIFMGESAGYSNIGSNNIIMGYQAGYYSTTGDYNIFFGNQSGAYNTGTHNLFIGYQAGLSNTSGWGNTFLGFKAGANSAAGTWNIAIGQEAGLNVKGGSNIIMGYQAGAFGNLTGMENTFIGTQSGLNTSTGYRNIFIGTASGQTNIDGYQNLFMGNGTGNKNTSGSNNVFLGNFSGGANTTGVNNVFAGSSSGNKNTLGNSNVFLGNQAGFSNTTGSNNILIGDKAGALITTAGSNTQMGYYSGYISTGANNTFFGAYAGYSLTSGEGNVFIGYGAGSTLASASNRLYIENSMFSDNTLSLIYGEFDNDYLRLNANTDIIGRLGVGRTAPATRLDILGGNWNVTGASEGDVRIGDANYRLKIGVATAGGGAGDVRINAMGGLNRIILGGNGSDVLAVTSPNVYPMVDNLSSLGLSGYRWSVVYSAGGVVTTSDIRMKSNIQDLEYGLESIMKLEPVSYIWKDGTDKNRRLGLIAQDVDKVITEVVDKGNDAAQTLGINYSELVPVLIKGMQEQQKQIDELKAMVDQLVKEKLK